MEIAILNHCFLQDARLSRLRALGKLTIHEDTLNETQAVDRFRGVDIAVVDGFKIPTNSIQAAKGGNCTCAVLP
jgi:hypothetical protein